MYNKYMEKYYGLKNSEVKERLTRDGYNEIPSEKSKSIFSLILSLFKEPMILLLSAAGLLYLLLGEPKDAVVLLFSIIVVIAITLFQQHKTEGALQALRDLSSPRALVVREGQQIRIPGREVVIDDIINLFEGDRIPADAVVLFSQNLQIDESLLTGESLPVNKIEWDGVSKQPQPGGDNAAFVYSGTLITQGSGTARVTSIGIKTEMGKIGKTLSTISEKDPPLKKELAKIVSLFLVVGSILCLSLIFIQIFKGEVWINAFLSGLTLSMAMLPEEFPVVLLIFFTLGAWRLSKKNVLTRNNQAIETLGAATVLCVDKTGTLTLNLMRFSSIVTENEDIDLSNPDKEIKDIGKEIFEYTKLASKRHAYDPLEKEINEKFDQYISKGFDIYKDWHLKKQYNLSKEIFAISRVWQSPTNEKYIIASKGAPEAIMKLCKMDELTQNRIMKKVEEMSNNGQRVLAVAKAEFEGSDFPLSQSDFDHKYLGLIGFVDPIRPDVSNSVKECYKAGIRVIMITGDYPGTAQFIAAQAGIKNTLHFITGTELEKLSKEELQEKINNINIFARVVPEQKLAIIEALKSNNEIVAMTGDGVNDAPALKTAHIGIAMGERGTDVARESSDLVLLGDDFTSIVSAVKLGRRIYDNLQKAVSYIFSIHIPIAGIALLPTLFDLPTLLYPVHIAFLELVIDPACSTVYESEHSEAEIMKRSPRNIKKRLFEGSQVLIASLQGFTLLATAISVFLLSIFIGDDSNTARTLAFLTMVLTNLALILVNLSRKSALLKFETHKNKAFYFISLSAVLFLAMVLSTPFLRDIFHFSQIGFIDFTIVLITTLICYFLLELLKIFRI
ncbi:hypothetical protein A2V49_01075 [candidate division WWE3 bacterium RBG_19FT_COMBO_34_6]|uniref:Cation-transporting P-type ATPase N-terminal domain-containing protein n=1 Tax=candidate division WWE3 bacterium RBG_19FT_COMBO_34_6 TaxID=1802612 RepID=A0A1F4UKW4_UNCKA|nr:MAG: hypothetical protein A2V49_01075 [candidate division WWE3 bacterium RBG_19FT_COMBO_34_6]